MKSIARTRHLAQRLRQSGDSTHAFFGHLGPENWNATVYKEGGQWSVSGVLAHLISTECATYELIQDILSGGPGAPQDYNIDAFNQREVECLSSKAPKQLLLDFEAARAITVTLVQRMTTADLQLRGRHPWLGNTDLSKIIRLINQHNKMHVRDIRRTLRGPDAKSITQGIFP